MIQLFILLLIGVILLVLKFNSPTKTHKIDKINLKDYVTIEHSVNNLTIKEEVDYEYVFDYGKFFNDLSKRFDNIQKQDVNDFDDDDEITENLNICADSSKFEQADYGRILHDLSKFENIHKQDADNFDSDDDEFTKNLNSSFDSSKKEISKFEDGDYQFDYGRFLHDLSKSFDNIFRQDANDFDSDDDDDDDDHVKIITKDLDTSLFQEPISGTYIFVK